MSDTYNFTVLKELQAIRESLSDINKILKDTDTSVCEIRDMVEELYK